MNHPRWRNLWMVVVASAGLTAAASAHEPGKFDDGALVVIREPGKPDRRCLLLQSLPQVDGTTFHELRDLGTGETFRVADSRLALGGTGWGSAQLRRLPTPAELAGSPAGSMTANQTAVQKIGFSRPTTKPATPPAAPRQPPAAEQPATAPPPAPLQAQLAILKDAAAPADRELAAMILTLTDTRLGADVVAALTQACRVDKSASVRAACVRCLYRIAAEAPQVILAIQERQHDPDPEVQAVASQAMHELARQTAERIRR